MMCVPKINSVRFGGPVPAAAFVIGIVRPVACRLLFSVFPVWLCALGGLVFAAFLVVFAVEMSQDFGQVLYYKRSLREDCPYDPEKHIPAVRVSVCNGERQAGFVNRKTGRFTEVMPVRSEKDLERFKKIYGIESVRIEL